MLILFNGQKQWREVNPGKGTACSQSGASQRGERRENKEGLSEAEEKTTIMQQSHLSEKKKNKRREHSRGGSSGKLLTEKGCDGGRDGAKRVFSAG